MAALQGRGEPVCGMFKGVCPQAGAPNGPSAAAKNAGSLIRQSARVSELPADERWGTFRPRDAASSCDC